MISIKWYYKYIFKYTIQAKTGKYKFICKQAVSVVSSTNSFINFWLRFFDTRRETQFLKVFCNHTMLTSPPTFGTSCGVYDLNSSLPVEIRKTQLFDSMAESPTLASMADTQPSTYMVQCQFSIDSFSKSSNSLDHFFQAWRHSHSSPFPVWGFIMTMLIVISFACERKTAPNDYALN